jgi:hypothetical protein
MSSGSRFSAAEYFSQSLWSTAGEPLTMAPGYVMSFKAKEPAMIAKYMNW